MALTAAVIVLGTICFLQAALLWVVWMSKGGLGPLRRQLSQLNGAIALLADTTEASFQAVAQELGRAGAAPAKPGSTRPVTRRVVRAARQGRPLHEIAAQEGMSEGEVHLRVHLAEAATSRGVAQNQEGADASLCAQ
jgi:hypothetical protein